jgi:TonB family protein
MADSGFEELERHFEAATLALGRGDRSAAANALRAVVRDAEVRDDAIEPLTLALTRLGELELEEGRESDAEGYFQRALALGERRLGAEHPDLVVMLNALSRLYLRRGAHELAEPILQRLYTIKRAKGEEHPEVATVLASLANVRQHLGRYDAAEGLWRRVLEIRERTLAPNHVATASALERLAETCAARAKAAEAVQLMQRALAMRELTLGGAHPTVRALRERIADLQLQAADDDGDLGPLTPITAPTAIPGWRPPTPAAGIPAVPPVTSQAMPPVAAPVVPPPAAPFAPAPATPSYAPAPAPVPMAASRTHESTFAVAAPRAITIPYAPPLPATIPAADAAAGEQAAKPQMALVMPGASADGGLAIQQLLAQIDADADAEANQPGLAARTTTLFREHRGPAIVGGVLLLLGAAFTVAKARGTDDENDLAAELMRTTAPTATATPGLGAPRYGVDGVSPSAATGTAITAASMGGIGATDAETHRTAEPAAKHEGATSAPVAPATPSASRAEERPREREVARPATAAAGPSIASLSQARLDDITRAASAATATATQDPLADRLASVSKSAAMGEGTSMGTRTATTQPARLIGMVPVARYPQSLRQSGVEGEVRVTFEVDTLGRPDMRTLAILKSDHELFTRAVRGVISEMRFVPAETDGKKTRWLVRMPFVFTLGPR